MRDHVITLNVGSDSFTTKTASFSLDFSSRSPPAVINVKSLTVGAASFSLDFLNLR